MATERLINSELAFLVMLGLVALFTAVHRVTHPNLPPDHRRAVRQVWIRILVFVGSVAVATPAYLSNDGELPTNPILLVVGLWIAIFSFPVVWYSLRWTFGVGDVDPRFGPWVTALAAITAFVLDFGKVVVTPNPVPDQFEMFVKVAAVASVTCLAALEYRAIQSAGPQPASSQPAPRPNRPYSSSAAAGMVACLVMPPVGIVVAGWAALSIDSDRERGRDHVILAGAFATVLMVIVCSGGLTSR